MADSSGDESDANAQPNTVEQMLQVIMANQERIEERNTRTRFVAMQATIDAQEAARSAATAAQAGASIWAAPAPAAPAEVLRPSAITPNAAAPIAPSTVPAPSHRRGRG